MRDNIVAFSIVWTVMLCFALVTFFTSGCGTIQLKQPEQDVVIKISARRIGYNLQQRHPEIAEKMKPAATEITENDDLSMVLMDNFITILTMEMNDPLIGMDLRDLFPFIEIDESGNLVERRINNIRTVASGLLQGIELGEKQ